MFGLLLGAIFGTAWESFNSDMNGAYAAFSYACHQKLSRSYCLFRNDVGAYWISDCTKQTGKFTEGSEDRKTIKTIIDDVTGYKLAVCVRDIGIYGGLLIGGLLYPLGRDLRDRRVMPTIWLILALVPMGLDGTIQLVSEFGILPLVYESSNLTRLVTGGIAGIVAAFYAIPILMTMFDEDNENDKEDKNNEDNKGNS